MLVHVHISCVSVCALPQVRRLVPFVCGKKDTNVIAWICFVNTMSSSAGVMWWEVCLSFQNFLVQSAARESSRLSGVYDSVMQSFALQTPSGNN
jgi:hypothetical protein